MAIKKTNIKIIKDNKTQACFFNIQYINGKIKHNSKK